MPASKVSLRLMSVATNSVGLTAFPLISEKWVRSRNASAASSSRFKTRPTVTRAYVPRWEPMISGWSSQSLMTPMPRVPLIRGRSSSNLLRNWALVMSWIKRVKPERPWTAIPPRRVPR